MDVKNNNKRDSVRDSILKAKDKIESEEKDIVGKSDIEDAPEATEPEASEPSADDSAGEQSEQISDTDQVEEVGELEAQPLDAPATEPTAKADYFEPPASWSAEAKANWNNLPKAVQKDAVRRELELRREQTRIQQEYGGLMNNYGGVIEAISPYERELRMRGYTPTTFVNQLIAEKEFEDTDPRGYILQKMQQYQINPQALIQQQPNVPPELQRVLAPLQQQLQAQAGYFEQMKLAEARRVHAEAEARNNAIYSETQNFLIENSNNPLFNDPEFTQELGEQAAFLTQKNPHLSPSERLKKAFERTLKLSTKGQTFLAQQNKAKSAQAQMAKIAAAKAAGSSISGNASDRIAEIKPGKTVNSAVRAAVRKQKAA